MTQEQKDLLYQITCLYADIFYLTMNSRRSTWDYEQDAMLNQKLKHLEKEYEEKYGELPSINDIINNVWDTRDKLKKELVENE